MRSRSDNGAAANKCGRKEELCIEETDTTAASSMITRWMRDQWIQQRKKYDEIIQFCFMRYVYTMYILYNAGHRCSLFHKYFGLISHVDDDDLDELILKCKFRRNVHTLCPSFLKRFLSFVLRTKHNDENTIKLKKQSVGLPMELSIAFCVPYHRDDHHELCYCFTLHTFHSRLNVQFIHFEKITGCAREHSLLWFVCFSLCSFGAFYNLCQFKFTLPFSICIAGIDWN